MQKKIQLFLATGFKIWGGVCLKKGFVSDFFGGGSPRDGQNFFAFLDDSDHA